MACSIDKGKARYCKVQPGGIDKVFIIDRFDANAVKSIAFTSGVATADSGLVSYSGTADSTEFFQFDTDPNLSALTQTIVVNEGGGVGYQQDLELVFKGAYGAADVVMQTLVGSITQIAVLDNTGTVYLCGLDKGMICTGGSFVHNGDKLLSDNVGYTFTFSATEVLPASNLGSLANFTGQDAMKTISTSQVDGS